MTVLYAKGLILITLSQLTSYAVLTAVPFVFSRSNHSNMTVLRVKGLILILLYWNRLQSLLEKSARLSFFKMTKSAKTSYEETDPATAKHLSNDAKETSAVLDEVLILDSYTYKAIYYQFRKLCDANVEQN